MRRGFCSPFDWAIYFCIGIALGASGCSRSKATPVEEDLGTLPWLRHTTDSELAQGLGRVEEQQGTPTQLEADWPDDADNVAVALDEVFKPGVLKRALTRSDELMPAGAFVFGAVELVPVTIFRQGHEFQRRKVVDALRRKTCCFKIRYTDGLLADMSPLDTVRLAVRLESFRVAESLAESRPVDAIEPLTISFQLIHLIASEQHVVYRLEAASLREESLRVLAAVAQHPQTSSLVLRRLGEMLAEQLAGWPEDRRAWFGDRAIGLHAYEMVRDGQIYSLLTDDEYAKRLEDGTLVHLATALKAKGVLDRDEQYYMQTMQRIIDACDKPYYQRKDLFGLIENELDKAQRSSEFRFVSGRILLPPIEGLHRKQARDRARCEAWTLAIARAIGVPPPDAKLNPLTGKPYSLKVESRGGQADHVIVTGIGDGPDDDEPVVVPVPRGGAA